MKTRASNSCVVISSVLFGRRPQAKFTRPGTQSLHGRVLLDYRNNKGQQNRELTKDTHYFEKIKKWRSPETFVLKFAKRMRPNWLGCIKLDFYVSNNAIPLMFLQFAFRSD